MRTFIRAIFFPRWLSGLDDANNFHNENITGEALTLDLNCLGDEWSVYLFEEDIKDFYEKLAVKIFYDNNRNFSFGVSFVKIFEEDILDRKYSIEEAFKKNFFNLKHYNIKKEISAKNVLNLANYIGEELKVDNYIHYDISGMFKLFCKYKKEIKTFENFSNKKESLKKCFNKFKNDPDYNLIFN